MLGLETLLLSPGYVIFTSGTSNTPAPVLPRRRPALRVAHTEARRVMNSMCCELLWLAFSVKFVGFSCEP